MLMIGFFIKKPQIKLSINILIAIWFLLNNFEFKENENIFLTTPITPSTTNSTTPTTTPTTQTTTQTTTIPLHQLQ